MNDKEKQNRYFLEIAYDGAGYSGWQVQPEGHGKTVQGVVEAALYRIYSERSIRIHASGRTDAGVHAVGQTATYDEPENITWVSGKLLKALNSVLPKDVVVKNLCRVEPDFHARYSAKAKAYVYMVNTGTHDPFIGRWCWNKPECLDVSCIRRSLELIRGQHDFAAFTVKSSEKQGTVRNIYTADLVEFENLMCFVFIGNGFLYRMVRGIVGTLVSVGAKNIPPDKVAAILESRNRSEAGKTAPPNGLFLYKVFYKPGEWDGFRLGAPPPFNPET